jgi:hypothetical protein
MRASRTRPRSLAAAACLSVAVAGCGSTIERTDGTPLGARPGLDVVTEAGSPATAGADGQPALGTSQAPAGGEVALGDAGVPAPSPGAHVPAGGAVAGGTTTGTATAAAPSGRAAGASTKGSRGTTKTSGASGAQAAAAGTGRGFTAKEIRFGFTYSADGAALAGGLGVNTAYFNAGDVAVQVNAIAKYVNDHGGVLGRKLVPVERLVSTQEAVRDANTAAEKLCRGWTEDDKVFFGMNATGVNNPVMRACMYDHDTPLFEASGRTFGIPEFRKYPSHMYTPGAMTSDLESQLFVSSLVAQKFFTGWDSRLQRVDATKPVKIGLLVADRADNVYKAARIDAELRKHGLKVDEQFVYEASLDGAARGSQAAELKFTQAGVTHVFGAASFFLRQADSQRYYPRYAVEPGAAAAAAVDPSAKTQMPGAMSAGYLPAVDVAPQDYPGDPNAQAQLCKKIMDGAGQDYSQGDLVLLTMLGECDVLFTFAAALNRSGTLSVAGLRAGIEGLGATLPSPQTWNASWSADKHASASVIRDQLYLTECECFRYSSTTNRSS